MAESDVANKRKIRSRPKVKSGCATCRTRKIKCDEAKPFCVKCVKTGRTCDGYESPFRSFACKLANNAHAGGGTSDTGSRLIGPTFVNITLQDIGLLNRYFSIKTMFDVKLDCEEEARKVLQASLTDTHVRHAVSSLRALRDDLETAGDSCPSCEKQTSRYHYGLQQYSIALGGLASRLSSPSSNNVKSSLLCCQVFISIEQVQKNYAAMVQHIVQGLRIMHESRARPGLGTANRLVPANHDQVPFLDVFVIKLFAAPCKFADLPVTAGVSRTTLSVCSVSSSRQADKSRDLRTIAPDMRTELTRIARSTLLFLDKVSQVESRAIALQLLTERRALLESLRAWLTALELAWTETGPSGTEPLSVSFSRFFHLTLKIILLGTLDFSPDVSAERQIEHDRLQDVANVVGQRVRTYKMYSGSSSV